jgi:hypothetical protein
MAKKGLDEDRLKFFKGMGGAETSESDKTESDKIKSAISESDKSESDQMKSAISESESPESDKTESRLSESDKTESDKIKSAISESESPESDKAESRLSESDKIKSAISESESPESDKTESRLSESDNRKSTNKRRQATKVPLPRSRASSTTPKIRARKVDDSVLDQAISAASKSPKVSIYSPFVAAVMKCNELTTIGYKSSADSRELLEKALEQAYPDVCEKVRRYMENK